MRVIQTDIPNRNLIRLFNQIIHKKSDRLSLGTHFTMFPNITNSLSFDGYEDIHTPPTFKRRMWKGGKMYFYNPLEYKELEMVTVCNKVDIKTTKMGEAYFTHITKKIQDGDLPILLEERTLVYLNREYQESNNVIKKMNFPDFSRTVVPTPLMLFQFSACTFNSHYIHYDSIYTKEKENYPKLLVHGPLTLSLLLNMFETHANGKKPLSFEYSCIGPAFVNEKLQLHCKFQSDSCQLWATNHLDSVVLKGVLKFELL